MKVYFDNAATTPIDKRVVAKMLPFLNEHYGNPSSIHSFGRKVRVAIEEARENVAEFLNADASEIYFVSGGTEANNFLIQSLLKTNFADTGRNEIISTLTEHHSVFETISESCENGFAKKYISLTSNSYEISEDVKKLISKNTSLVSLIHTNNETGQQLNIHDIKKNISDENIYFHTDAVQAFAKSEINIKKINIDSLSASGHKIYAPKGIGILFAKSGTPLESMIYGGSQERNRRGGTENVAGIIGFSEAVNIARNEMNDNAKTVEKIKHHFIKCLSELSCEGLEFVNSDNYSPYILSLTFNSDIYKIDSEAMLMYLDINGVAASNGAACTSGTLNASHVLTGLGMKKKDAEGTIRFSFSPKNTNEEVEYVVDVLSRMTVKFRKT